MKIEELNMTDRPRERLINLGASALSDVELLAVLIGSGGASLDVFGIAKNLLKEYSLPELKNVKLNDLLKFKGIKVAKACQIIASLELAKRVAGVEKCLSLENSQAIYKYVYGDLFLEATETIVVVFVNARLKVIKKKCYFSDRNNSIDFPLRDIVSTALAYSCYGLILAHNHPSGSLKPSVADLESTMALLKILKDLDIVFLDHLIVNSFSYYSFFDEGLLNSNLEYNQLGDLFESDD